VRNWHLLRAIADRHVVTLLLLNDDAAEMDADQRRFCARVIRPPRRTATPAGQPSRIHSLLETAGVLAFPWRRNWEALAAYAGQHCGGNLGDCSRRSKWLLSKLLSVEINLAAIRFTPPPMLTLYLQEAARSLSRDTMTLLAEERYDVLWFEHSFCYPVARRLLPASQKPIVVCDAHNVESELQRRCAAIASTPAEARWLELQSKLLRRVETDAFQSCDLTFACSEDDASLIRQLAHDANVITVPNGVDTEYFRPRAGSAPAMEPTLLFTGNFAYQPNCDALMWFITEIFPRIRAAVPNCRFVFAGLDAQGAFDRMRIQPDGVQCVSDPADMRPQFEAAGIFVVPLRAGGGTRLKILEAMAMERPIVSTKVGAEGIPCQDGRHILLADSPIDFANAVFRLIADGALRARLASQAALWVRENYNWQALCGNAVKALDVMLAPSCRSGTESNP
jgi:glycosyltransferase involved in cell wall biosynthesis